MREWDWRIFLPDFELCTGERQCRQEEPWGWGSYYFQKGIQSVFGDLRSSCIFHVHDLGIDGYWTNSDVHFHSYVVTSLKIKEEYNMKKTVLQSLHVWLKLI